MLIIKQHMFDEGIRGYDDRKCVACDVSTLDNAKILQFPVETWSVLRSNSNKCSAPQERDPNLNLTLRRSALSSVKNTSYPGMY